MTNRLPFDAVLCTEQLKFRAHRGPDFEVESRMLRQMIGTLCDPPATILRQLAEIMLKDFNVGSAGVSIHAKEHGIMQLRWAALAGEWSSLLDLETSREFRPGGDALDFNAPLLFRKLQWHYPAFRKRSPDAEECLLVPFRVHDKVLGAIWLVFHDDEHHFNSESLRQLLSVSEFTAAAYNMVTASEDMRVMNQALLVGSISQHEMAEAAEQLNEQLREEIIRRINAEGCLIDEANRDKLTNLLNRRAYEEVMIDAYQRLQRNGETMGLIAVDVDHFKNVNDTYGHYTGDEVLKEVATALVASVRGIDKVFRIGGEEFSIFLPGADKIATITTAERLRKAVELRVINTEKGSIRITISLGLAVGLHFSHTPEKLRRSADLALYQAKAQGRNIVIPADLSLE